MKYSIQDEKIVFDDHYKIVEAQVQFESFKGDEITARRLAFERGDSVAIILYEYESQSLLLINQFRYPTCKHDQGWLLEIVAGSMEKGESPSDCVQREVLEETGYRVTNPEPISTFYVSPGGCTERCFLYYAEVSKDDKIEKGGGLDEENEDIQLVRIPISEITDMLSTLKDGKTIIAIQWFMMNKLKLL